MVVITVSGLSVKTDLNIRSKHMKSLILNEFVKELREACENNSSRVASKNENILHLENGDEETVVFISEKNVVLKYHSHIGMLKDELEEFLPLARVWKDNYSYKKYSLSILMGPNDWYYELKKAKILGLIRGMNIKQ